jgi:hypothetical protein
MAERDPPFAADVFVVRLVVAGRARASEAAVTITEFSDFQGPFYGG